MKAGARLVAPVEVATKGEVAEPSVVAAREKISHVLERFAHEPVLEARVRLIHEPNPSLERPMVAKARVDMNGHFVHASVAADTMSDAIDLLEYRLRQQLDRFSERREARYHDTGVPEAGEWRHAALSPARPEWYDRPVEEREIVARKTYAAEPRSVDEAAFDLDMAESDFTLFVDAATGLDSFLHRRSDGSYQLITTDPHAAHVEGAAVDVTVDPIPPPRLSLEDARDSLDVALGRFVVFVDDADGRMRVLYHRYDGHYGLIDPAQD